jgi:acyl carrier protein
MPQSTRTTTTAQSLPHANTSNQDDAATEAVIEPRWLFSMEQLPTNGHSLHMVPMAVEEKIELFLKQETALQLHRPIEEIYINMSYFDLGLSSLAITTLVHKVNKLLNESLSPTTLFEQRDIQSLAAYLAATYPSKIDALTVIKQEVGQTHSEEQQKIHPTNHAPLPRTEDSSVCPEPSLHEQTSESAPKAESNGMRVSEEVWWQEMSLNNGYEKVTF